MTGVAPSENGSSSSSSSFLKLIIRLSSSARFEIGGGDCGTIITPSSTVRQIKELIAQRDESGHCAVERQRLIYKGRILSEDTRTLAFYGIEGGHVAGNDGIVLYLVKGGGATSGVHANSGSSANATAAATSNTSTVPSSQPNPNANLNSNPFLNFGNANSSTNNNPYANMMNSMMGAGGGGGGGMPDLASFQQQLQQNPQMMSEMMNNPMVQSLMNSPDFLRSMMESNPQMRQIMDSNPELRHALEDPEFMRRSMEMMRDPSAMQNMMRNQDLAMSQIENMPGGYSALRRMYEDVQEPMMDAMMSGSSGSRGGGDSSGGSNSASGANSGQGATNRAMPNPWGAPAPSATSGAPTSQGGAGGANPFASLMGNMGGMGSFGMPPGAGGGGSAAAASNPWANPAMGPNGPNLEATLQMMENPMMQNMMQNMLNNPEAMRMMMESNPMIQQLRQTNPQAAAIFENPQAIRAMMDPTNVRAMIQMQQAMEQLNGSMSGIGGIPTLGGTGGGAAAAPPAGGLDFSNLLGSSSSGTNRGASSAAPMANPFMFPFMPPAAGGGQHPVGGNASQPAPGQRFRQQLNSLHDMGFTDRSANIRALTSSHGNVNRAIEILLESPPEMGDGSDTAGADPAVSGGNTEDVAVSQSTDENGPDESSAAKEPTEKKND